MPQEADNSLIFRQADSKDDPGDEPFVVVVRSREELSRWLHERPPALQWIQIEAILGDSEVWELAAQGADEVPVDVLLAEPEREFSDLYGLVDVRSVRDVRVSMRAISGFFKALKLAASLGLPVRLLPGQPPAEALRELGHALEFYLRDPTVEAPIEFFHSALAWMRGAPTGSLWRVLEEDPAIYQRGEMERSWSVEDSQMQYASPKDFVHNFFAHLVQTGAECATCPWQEFCQGYFKWPAPGYSCEGVKLLFSSLRTAADEIEHDLAAYQAEPA